jgi:hypothetical protein
VTRYTPPKRIRNEQLIIKGLSLQAIAFVLEKPDEAWDWFNSAAADHGADVNITKEQWLGMLVYVSQKLEESVDGKWN